MKSSIHRRLSLATLILLVFFLGLTGVLLDSAQQQSLESEINNRLLGHVYALLGEAREGRDGGLVLPADPTDPRLRQPDSGLRAELLGRDGRALWRSASLLGLKPSAAAWVDAGEQRFFRDQGGYQLLFGLAWESLDGGLHPYTLRIGLQAQSLDEQSQRFRWRLWGGLLVLGLFLLILQGALLRWGLLPLRQMVRSVREIESGQAERVEGVFPDELQHLADSLNSLIRHNHQQQERFRTSLDDLAHSIKTPLALLQGALDSNDPVQLSEAARQAVPHIDTIVKGRLKRAALSGFAGLGQRVALHGLANRLIATLEKVYRDRVLQFENRLAEGFDVPGDENDFMEVLGNLLDNAAKFARTRVRIDFRETDDEVRFWVEDDGPGIDPDKVAQVLVRGGRLDEQHPGQGIGLASVDTIIGLYGGELGIDRSPELGGARISVRMGRKSRSP